jgi:hypothetical protein
VELFFLEKYRRKFIKSKYYQTSSVSVSFHAKAQRHATDTGELCAFAKLGAFA